jgi:hypothetical protein
MKSEMIKSGAIAPVVRGSILRLSIEGTEKMARNDVYSGRKAT